MPRVILPLLLLLTVLSAGCIPVTEPVSDLATAEPDKGLLGTWKGPDGETALTIATANFEKDAEGANVLQPCAGGWVA